MISLITNNTKSDTKIDGNMFTNIKNRFISVIAPDAPPLPSPSNHHSRGGSHVRPMQQLQDKFAYARPPFLQLLTPDELRASADHNVRPIIVPRDITLLPWYTGYAECVNSGKSEWNEDQAAFCRQVLSDPDHRHPDLPYTYFGIFDGHAGYGAALAASHQFHHILHEKLVDCIDMLLPRDDEGRNTTSDLTNGGSFLHPMHFQRHVSKDELIIGALESAFFHMDSLIAQDRNRYRDAGGCTACVALFINGKMFVANAGDSRAVLCQLKRNTSDEQKRSKERPSGQDEIEQSDALNAFPVPFSFDHTPETERQRLLNVARLKPNLLGKQYAAMEYAKRPHVKDLGQRILCRQGTMKGWTYKTLTRDDLRMPVVIGEGKRSRLLGTLGVTRGFGDHDLHAITTGIQIKPFLTPHPDVTHRDLSKIVSIPDENNEDGDYGILIMATDGLWDVSENEAVARTVFQTLEKYPSERHRYTMVAQELVAKARGKINDSGHWRLADSKAAATVDDISVIVVPVYQYYKEHVEWEKKCFEELRNRRARHEEQQAKEATEEDGKQVLPFLNGTTEPTSTVTKAEINLNNDEDEDEVLAELNKQIEQATIDLEEETIIESSDTPQKIDKNSVSSGQNAASVKYDEKTNSVIPESDTVISKKEDATSSPENVAHKSKQKKNNNRKDKR